MTLDELKKYLKKQKITAYYLTRNNMFLEEDILPEENKIMELTGFSGSAGNLIVTAEKAYLFIDGRYQIQAGLETNPQEVEIICAATSSPLSWIVENLNKNKSSLMYDPWCTSSTEIKRLKEKLPQIKLIPDQKQILGSRLSEKKVHVFELSEEYAGISTTEKISELLKIINSNNLDAFLITSAHEVSWLLNLRSDALPDSPVLRAFTLIKKDGTICLFGKNLDYPNILPFSKMASALKKIKKKHLGISTSSVPQIINDIYGEENLLIVSNPIEQNKIHKNPIEIQGFINAHKKDAIAMIKFLFWLENNWQGKTELDIVEKIDSLRKEQPLYYAKSFDTIAASGENAAIVHYHPTEKSNKKLKKNSVLLLDSGAHYFDGTTDITRTIALGTPPSEIINAYTYVLKAHIALASCNFPPQTSGPALDAICRKELWSEDMDFKHGTGHGVGFMLNVHETPLISPNSGISKFNKNIVTSIEPGFYKENHFGIRIENLYYVSGKENSELLKFEVLTLVPIDKRLINKYLLNDGEIKWLNEYHQKIKNTLNPLLSDELQTWLNEACSPL